MKRKVKYLGNVVRHRIYKIYDRKGNFIVRKIYEDNKADRLFVYYKNKKFFISSNTTMTKFYLPIGINLKRGV